MGSGRIAPVIDFGSIGDPRNWDGGFYELSLELGDEDDTRLDQAARSLARLSGADGWYPSVDDPSDVTRLECTLEVLAQRGQLRGTVALPNGDRVVCAIVATREDSGFYRPDWLSFFIPLGALERADSRVGGYPFGDFNQSLTWRRPIDNWLANLAGRIYARTPFRLGLIGMEVAGEAYSPDIAKSGVPERSGIAYLIPDDGSLEYVPATE